jgi:transposase
MDRRMQDERLSRLAEGLARGLSCREVAAEIGVSAATAIRWAKRCGLKSRRSRLLAPETRDTLLQALGEGATAAEAATRARVGAATAERWARRAGIALPRRRPVSAERLQRRQKLFDALASGLSRRKAAAFADLPISTAIRWARERGK